jgi:hypothetical protein
MVLSNRPYDRQWTIAHVAADLSESRPDVAFMGSSRVATLFDAGLVEQRPRPPAERRSVRREP